MWQSNFGENHDTRAESQMSNLFSEDIELIGLSEPNVSLVSTFEGMQIRPELLHKLQEKKYKKLLPIQRAAYSLLTGDFNIMGSARTGAGKTSAYLIPIMNWILHEKSKQGTEFNAYPFCVILSPTRELAEQIFHQAQEFSRGTSVKVLVSLSSMSYNMSRGICDIFVATVGRFVQFVSEKWVTIDHLKFMVLDEVDLFFKDHFFNGFDSILTILRNDKIRKALFSATVNDISKGFYDQLFNTDFVQIIVGKPDCLIRPIQPSYIKTDEYGKHCKLLTLMRDCFQDSDVGSTRPPRSVMVFAKSKKRCSVIAVFLSLHGFISYPAHSKMSVRSRKENIKIFQDGKCPILVTTDPIGRGVDLRNVSHVINYDMPTKFNWISYKHLMDRIAQLETTCLSTTFFNPEFDKDILPFLETWLRENELDIPDFMKIFDLETDNFVSEDDGAYYSACEDA